MLEERNKANALQRKTRSKNLRLTTAKSRLQQYTRERKSQWWEEKAEALQQAADRNDMKAFYNGLREVYGPQEGEQERVWQLQRNFTSFRQKLAPPHI